MSALGCGLNRSMQHPEAESVESELRWRPAQIDCSVVRWLVVPQFQGQTDLIAEQDVWRAAYEGATGCAVEQNSFT